VNLAKWSAGTKSVLICLSMGCGFAIFSSSLSSIPAAPPEPAQTRSNSSKELSEAEITHMSSDQLAKYVFEHHGCDGCHTLGSNGKFGFTERGKQVGKGFIGCISLLTSMNLISQVDPANRTTDEKEKAAKFTEFGCTSCHQIMPGKLGLTSYGARLKSFHMACTDVEKILNGPNGR
jgi:cytochrome c551/c552